MIQTRDVVFWDDLSDIQFIAKSNKETSLTIVFMGKTYPLIMLDKLDLTHIGL